MTQTAMLSHVTDSGSPDPYGNPTEVVTTVVSKCYVSFLPGSEVEGDAVQVQTPVLFLPPDAAIDGGDRVSVDGVTYEVDGVPAVHFNPRLRRTTHVQANLKRAG